MTRYNVQLALDPSTLQVIANVQNVSGQIVASGTATPVAITDITTGAAIVDSRLTVSANGFVPAFDTVVDAVNVDWWDGTNRIGLESAEGVKEDAAASAASAAASATSSAASATSASAAQTAAEAAQSSAAASAASALATYNSQVKTVNGVGPDSSGNVTVATGGGGGTGGAVTSVAGKTGDVSLVKGDVGLGQVDNTSDANKPVSTATASALSGKAATAHTHVVADVTGLQAALDSKAGLNAAVNASQVNAGTGVIDPTHLGTGTSITTKYLRGDGTWQVVSGGTGAVNSVNGQTGTVVLAAADVGALDSSTVFVASVAGKTGTVSLVKADVGLSNVDNTSDAAKPVSTPQAAAIAAKADASATVNLTGAQTVAGVKTFSSSPVVPDGSFTIAKTAGLSSALASAGTALPTKGAIAAGTGSGATAAVTVGTDGKVLTADSTQAAGVSWQLPGSDPTGPRTILAPSANALQAFHLALAKRRTRTARIAVIGTSNTKGDQLTSWDDRFVNRLQQDLRQQWPCPGAGGLGWISAFGYNSATQYSRLAVTGSASSNDGAGFGYCGLTAAGTITFTVPKGTSAALRYRKRQTGSFTWKVDSGTATTVNVTGTSTAPDYYLSSLSIPLPADSNSHTITITWVSGQVQVQGLVHYDGDEAGGIHAYGFGQSGASSGNFVGDDYGLGYVCADLGVDLVFIEFQGNDLSAGNTPAQLKANYQTIMNLWDSEYTALGKTPPVYILTSVTPATDDGATVTQALVDTWVGYQTVRNELAAAAPTRVSSMMLSGWLPVKWSNTTYFPGGADPTTGMKSNGTLFDSLMASGHWTGPGHALIADVIARYVATNMGKIG